MRGDEARVVEAFCDYLVAEGWIISDEPGYTYVVARRDEVTLYAEVKGRTTDPGLDADTMYGQLLRRMQAEALGRDTFAVVVPTAALRSALRVPERVRQILGIAVYEVTDSGDVILASSARELPSIQWTPVPDETYDAETGYALLAGTQLPPVVADPEEGA